MNAENRGQRSEVGDQKIPAGYIEDAQGRLVRAETVPPQDMMRDELVRGIVGGAKFRAANLKAWRAQVLGDVQAFATLVAEKYGAKLGRGAGLTLNSYDGRFRVVIAKDDKVTFNEQLAAAKALIWECVEKWTDGSRSEIKAIVSAAFKASRNGKLSITKIMALRQVQIDDPQWLKAMDALTDSLQVVGSATYLRCYERVGSSDKYQIINLDVFPEDQSGGDGGQKSEVSGQEGGAS